MQLLSLETKTARRVFWSAATGISVLLIVVAAQKDPVLIGGCIVLMLAGIWPLYTWAIGSHQGLPIWPAFAGYTSFVSALPIIQVSKSLDPYSDGTQFSGLMTVAGFLVVGTLVWAYITARPSQPPKKVLMLEPGSAVQALLWCIASAVVFNANNLGGWIAFPGNSMQIVRGITGGLSSLGVFALAFFHGSRLLRPVQIVLFYFLTTSMVLLSLAGIMLAPAIPVLTLIFCGYAMGARRMPWLGVAVASVAVIVLHTGKFVMRETYLPSNAGEPAKSVRFSSLPEFYAEWTASGLERLGSMGGLTGAGPRQDESSATALERVGNMHMLLLVLEKTPQIVPFLNGITYEPIPQLLIPRFLTPEKAVAHIGNTILSVNYGVLDEEAVKSTSIGWNLIAEAYANFGYVGVFLLSVLLASIYALVTRFTARCPITSFRFVAGLIVLAGVTNDNTLGVFITQQFQGVVGAGLASLFVMRRLPNPLAQQAGDGQHQIAKSVQRPGGPSTRAPWMPPRMRRRVAAERQQQLSATKEDDNATAKASRPRQVAVPIQPYYYRSRKA